MRFMTGRLKSMDEENEIESDWKFAAMVIDRLGLYQFSIFFNVFCTANNQMHQWSLTGSVSRSIHQLCNSEVHLLCFCFPQLYSSFTIFQIISFFTSLCSSWPFKVHNLFNHLSFHNSSFFLAIITILGCTNANSKSSDHLHNSRFCLIIFTTFTIELSSSQFSHNSRFFQRNSQF